MHVLYVHPKYPAQFGLLARRLAALGHRCTYVSRAPAGVDEGVERIQYRPPGRATRDGHYCARGFENTVWQCDGVYRALKDRPDVRPDLVVGHSGFGTTLFLPELYPDTPLLNYFEYYFRPRDPETDWGFRKDLSEQFGWVIPEMKYLRNRCRNAMILLDLVNCDAAYAPTNFQRSVFPPEYHPKINVVFDGVDRSVYHGHGERLRPPPASGKRRRVRIGRVSIAPGTRIVTYVSRGFEAVRGFDVFMRAARRIAELYPDVVFVVVGSDKIAYGHDRLFLQQEGSQSFREWLLAREQFDLSRFLFVGRLHPRALAQLLAATDLHVYLTAPFILSWSMVDAMSCGAVVLGSATAPVMELIRDGQNGLLADFFDVEGLAQKAAAALRDPAAYRPLGRAAEQTVVDGYSMEAVVPQMLRMYEAAANRTWPPASAATPEKSSHELTRIGTNQLASAPSPSLRVPS